MDFTACKDIVVINCRNCNISSLDISGCTSLTSLDCRDNKISSLDVADYSELTSLKCSNNDMASLYVSGCKSLKELDCSGNKLSYCADLYKCPSLSILDASNNKLTYFDATQNPSLYHLNLSGNNELGNLVVSSNLTYLGASSTRIKTLDCLAADHLYRIEVKNTPFLKTVICPSIYWLSTTDIVTDATLKNYVDGHNKKLYGNPVTIDGRTWACFNCGYSEDKKEGKYYIDDKKYTVACPEGWRLPTKEEFKSLIVNASYPHRIDGMVGKWFYGSKKSTESDAAVFLPFEKTSYKDDDYEAWYLTSTEVEQKEGYLYLLGMDKFDNYAEYESQYIHGFIRCIQE